MVRRAQIICLVCGAALVVAAVAAAQAPPSVGVQERLGEVLPLETFTFTDEDGQPMVLKTLFDRPIVLTLVYFRCPGICTPLLQEVARNVNNCDLTPGKDYRLVTISFDPSETAELARLKQANLLETVDKRGVSRDDWRFLTGDAETIKRITESLGFYYMKDTNGVDYVHVATVMFLSPGGKIVRYLNGLEFNPADLKMAVIDASEGRARSFMQRLQTLCYTYNPASRGYVLELNRIVLGVTVLFAVAFGAFLVFKKRRPPGEAPRLDGGNSE